MGLAASVTFNALLIRHLQIATYGQFVAATTYVGVFMILGESGLYLVSVRRAMQDSERRSGILGTALGLRLLWTVVPLTLAVVIAWWIPESRFPIYDRTVKLAIGILAFNEYVRLLTVFLTAIFRMHLRMELAVLGEVGSRIFALLGIVLVAERGGGLGSVAVALVVANGANLAYSWFMSQKLERFRPQLDRQLVREILGEAAIIAGVLIMSLLRTQIGTLLLSLQRASEDVGVYGVALKVYEVSITLPAMFTAILFPVLSRLAREDSARLRRLFQRTFDVLMLAAAGMLLVMLVLAPQFAAILGEPRAAAPMRLLAFAMPGIFLGMSLSHLALADGRGSMLLKLYVVLAIVSGLANLWLIPRFSYWSVAAISVGIETIVLLSLAIYWKRVRDLHLRLRAGWCIPIALILAVLLIRFAARWLYPEPASIPTRLLIAALGGAATVGLYVVAVTSTRLVDPEVVRALLPGKTENADTTTDTNAPDVFDR